MFLTWALPRLRMRWSGFRKVRGQVCKRIQKRIIELGFSDAAAYRNHLADHQREWKNLDRMCRITISRFYRDQQVFAFLERRVLPELARRVMIRNDDVTRVWSVGCSSGEEPYSVALTWNLRLRSTFPLLRIHILATDTDHHLIERAKMACYTLSSLKELPDNWRNMAFVQSNNRYCLKPEHQTCVEFLSHDVRNAAPDGPFDLILCRNLVFTYFEYSMQRELLSHLYQALHPDGELIIGADESLPEENAEFTTRSRTLGVYRKQL